MVPQADYRNIFDKQSYPVNKGRNRCAIHSFFCYQREVTSLDDKALTEGITDPHALAVIAQLKLRLAKKQAELEIFELKVQSLEEHLRLERIARYGTRSETLSDLQLSLLDFEPAVSDEEIAAESARPPLPVVPPTLTPSRSAAKKHPGRNQLPTHLARVEKIVACTEAQCLCGSCGATTKVIGYEETEVLDVRPAEYFVTVIKREKRACSQCARHGVQTAALLVRIADKSIFSDALLIDFVMKKYSSALPLYRQQAELKRDAGLDLPLSTINDGVLRVGELLEPVARAMGKEILASGYVQADETPVGVQTHEKSGTNHTAYFWQYGSPGKGVVFDFRMSRDREGPRRFLKDYAGILQTDGYGAYMNGIGAMGMVHACCLAHARRKFVDAVKVNEHDKDSAQIVAWMDALFAIDREARRAGMNLEDRHALRRERARQLLAEIHAQLRTMESTVLPKSKAGEAVHYSLALWPKLTLFLDHPVLELSTNLAENSMRPIAIGRKNWLHLGSKEAGPKIAAIFSIVESCRRLKIPVRAYLTDTLPGLACRSLQTMQMFTPTAYANKIGI